MNTLTSTIATLMVSAALVAHPALAQAPATPPAAAPTTEPGPAAPPAQTTPAPTEPAPGATAQQGGELVPESIDLAARPALTIVGSSSWDDAEKSLSEAVNALYAAIARGKLEVAGAPLVEYLENGDDEFKFQAFVPVKQLPVKPFASKDIKGGETPSGKVLKFTHMGSFEDLEDVYNRIDDYLTSKSLQMLRVVEEYQSDPTSTPADQMVTNIYVFTE